MNQESFENVASEDIVIGDIIKIYQNQRIPADMVLLYVSESETEEVLLDTQNLDADTELKTRVPIKYTHEYYQHFGNFNRLREGYVYAEAPNGSACTFRGRFFKDSSENSDEDEYLNVNKTLW